MKKIEYGTEFLDHLKDSVHDLYDENKELKQELKRLNNIIEEIQNDMVYLDSLGINQVKPKIIWERIELLKGVDKE